MDFFMDNLLDISNPKPCKFWAVLNQRSFETIHVQLHLFQNGLSFNLSSYITSFLLLFLT